MNQFFLNTG